MDKIVSCSNQDCKFYFNRECTNNITKQELLNDEDTVYISVDSCTNEDNDEDEDPYEMDRIMFDVYIQQEADGYFD